MEAFEKELPLLVLRLMIVREKDYMDKIFAHCDRFPGTIDEMWFPADTVYTCKDYEELRKHALFLLPFVKECRKRNIRVGLQCATLGHQSKEAPPANGFRFSEEAWCVDHEGKKAYCYLCPSSPEVHEFFQRFAEIYLEVLGVDSLWPDDDLRLNSKDRKICFCPRCMALFNEETKRELTREELSSALFGENSSFEIRKEWVDFNGRMLEKCTAAFRRGVDAVKPDCFLGLQRPRSTHKYDTEDGSQLCRGLAGKENKPIFIRSGGGFYSDLFPRDIIRKSFDVGREAARLKANGFRGGVCAECESYPHISVQKNPGTLMTESAMAISAGSSFSTLCWHSQENREPDENNLFFMESIAKHRPFVEAVRNAARDTGLAGCALYEGKEFLAQPEWLGVTNETEERLMENSLPMSLPGASPEVFALDELSARSLGREDLEKCFAKPVLMDVAAFEVVKRKFPDLAFVRKVSLEMPKLKFHPITNFASELFEGKYKAESVFKAIRKVAEDVVLTSRIHEDTNENIGGTAIIPTEFGGSIVLTQFLNIWHGWTTYRRDNILDALDRIVPGRMAVRLLTGGYAVCIHARTTKEGKSACAFLFNTALGDTPPLKIALRDPAFQNYQLQRQMKEPLPLKVLSRTSSEIILELPPLEPFRAVLIEGIRE